MRAILPLSSLNAASGTEQKSFCEGRKDHENENCYLVYMLEKYTGIWRKMLDNNVYGQQETGGADI